MRTADNNVNTGQQAGQEHAEAHEALFNRISQVRLWMSAVYKSRGCLGADCAACDQAIDLSEEKVTLAQQMYDYVDQRIRQFDKDMQSFDAELLAERTRLGIPVIPKPYCLLLFCKPLPSSARFL